MHIEPGLVDASKILLSYATATAAFAYTFKLARDNARERGLLSVSSRALISTALVLFYFQVLPHQPIGVSEVHLILGSTLFLLFGAAPAAIGLASGLLLQGLFFAPSDLPQYGMNVTTLLVPLFAIASVARRIIAPNTPYVELSYRQALALSTTYQANIVAWVAFWVFYGQGFSIATLTSVLSFSAAYMAVVILEPLVDLAVLAVAKAVSHNLFFEKRLHQGA
ncbi:putative cobalt transporter CbtC [Marinobacterium lacunae]|uniref:Putative cobalt transporter CbtC n=1 Tax=Marinobacterium lacunae TaxID=1232683 RepID=A0A081FWZ4_9GAMM|nr:energy-coupling factor ABC transporter permease [Marinobacterium lacunae]KEA63049.1 putative cobalt transporter CbtC [Marinobacterium lacunae]